MPSPCSCLLQTLVVVGLVEALGLRLKSPIWTIGVVFLGNLNPNSNSESFVLGKVGLRVVGPPRG